MIMKRQRIELVLLKPEDHKFMVSLDYTERPFLQSK